MINNHRKFIDAVLQESGKIVLKNFGESIDTYSKKDKSQIVTEVDIQSEKLIIKRIEDQYPDYSIIAEESGYAHKKSEYTWIIDPIDGTSNYANGIGWFGIMMALLKNDEVIASGIYLPVTNEMYGAGIGEGSTKNNTKFVIKNETKLEDSLISFSVDPTLKTEEQDHAAITYRKLLPKVRNFRSTNSAVDYVYAAEGKLGGLISYKNALWDVAPISLIASEAGCAVTDLSGESINFNLTDEGVLQSYTLVIANPTLHKELINVSS